MSSYISVSESIVALRKQASAVADKRQAEQAFADQVYSLVVNRAAPFMTNERRLGFEIVHTNDDNTFMVGIWAVKLDPSDARKLVYIPCFFNGGKISVDSLYDVARKQFRPLTQEWCKHIIQSSTKIEGEPIDRSMTAKFRPNIRFNRIVVGGLNKRASVRSNQEFEQDLQEMFTLYEAPTERLLPKLASQVGGEKIASILMNSAERSVEFAERLARTVDKWADVYSAPTPAAQKQASAPEVPLCSILTRKAPALLAEVEKEKQAKVRQAVATKGFWFEGRRDPDAGPDSDYYTDVYDPTQGRHEFISVSGPGAFEILTSDGSTVKALVGHAIECYDLARKNMSPTEIEASLSNGDQGCSTGYRYSVNTPSKHEHAVVDLDDKRYYRGRNGLWALAGKEDAPADLPSVEEVKSGKTYVLYLPSAGYMTAPIKITEVKEQDGGKLIRYSYGELFVSPTQDAPYGYGTISKAWRAVELKTKERAESSEASCAPCCADDDVEPFYPGGDETMRAVLQFGEPSVKGLKQASVRSVFGDWFQITVDGRESSAGSELDAMVKLAGILGVHPETAQCMLEKAASEGKADYLLLPPEKLAGAMLRIVDTPYWQTTFDSTIMQNVQEDQQFILRTQRQPIYTPPGRVGDHFKRNLNGKNPKGPADMPSNEEMTGVQSCTNKQAAAPDQLLMQGSPEQLAQFASMEDDSVLDHGIVGAMTQISDLSIYLDQYVPNLETSIDYLGRCLFTLRVAPNEWTRLYGKDDVKEAEDRLVTNFRSLGECVLFLLQRTDVPRS